jgi:hypothetical protein
MSHYLLPAVLFLSVLLSTLVAAQDASYTFTTIDVPGAVTDSLSFDGLGRSTLVLASHVGRGGLMGEWP